MKKIARTFIISILALFLSIACKNYTDNIDDYLSYWSTEASIAGYTFDTVTQTDAEGMQCVSSKSAVIVTFTVRNPKNFNLKMPGDSGAPADIISFPNIQNELDKRATVPQAGIDFDYKFEKISNTELKLTYTADFLKQYEWGRGDIAPAIILYTTDGRLFKQAVPFKLKVNTPPPAIQKYIIAQTKNASSSETSYYVLCLQLSDIEMTELCKGGRLHDDIAGIEINGKIYTLAVDSKLKQLKAQDDNSFINKDAVEKLNPLDTENIPSGWVLYFKTDAPVGSPKTDAYTVRLKDAKGLYSKPVPVRIQLHAPKQAQDAVITGTKIASLSGDGTEQSKAIVIKAAEQTPEAQIKLSISDPVDGITIHYTLTEAGQTLASEKTGAAPVTVDMPLNGAGEKHYALTYYTAGIGFKPSDPKTVCYKVLKEHTVTFDSKGGSEVPSQKILHGSQILSIPATPTAPAGYTFRNWCIDESCTTAWDFASGMVTSDITLYAKWDPVGGVSYTVQHYQQNINDDNYTIVSGAIQTLNGTTGQLTTATANAYAGFEPLPIEQKTIAGDGSTVVEVKYKRKRITVTFKLAGGNISGSTADVTKEGKFGAAFTAPVPTRQGYDFEKWNPKPPSSVLPSSPTIPAANAEYTAQWTKKGDTPYKIEHYKQNINDDNYTIDSGATQSLNGETEASISVAPKHYEGFKVHHQEPASPTIAAGGNTIVKVYYNRNRVRLTFKLAGGKIDSSTDDVAKEGKFGATFTAPVPTRQGYTFNGWNPALPSSPTIPAANAEYTAQWTANQYKVQFNGNGSTGGSTSDQTFTYGTSQALQLNGFERTGYTFKGWAYSSDATSPSYTDGQRVENLTVTNNAVVQLYAVWHIKTYTVKFKVDGGQGGTLKGTYNSSAKTANGATEQQFESVPYKSTITFTAMPDSDYEVDSWTGATAEVGNDKKASLTVLDNVTVTVKFKLGVFNLAGNPSDAWQRLKAEAAKSQGAHIIVIDGEIKATSSGNNFGEITLGRTLTIRGKNDSAVLDANRLSRIFSVTSGKTLTLEKLTLKNGKATDSGGGIYVKDATLTIKGTTIQFCEAMANGGGIHLDDTATCTLKKVIIKACNASKGAGVYAKKSTLTMTECTIGGDNPSDTNSAGQQGGGIFVGEDAECTLKAGTKITNNGALSFIEANGGGIFVDKKQSGAKGGILIIEGREANPVTISNNTADGSGGGIFVSEDAQCILKQSVEIINNAGKTSGGYGGGVYIEGGLCTMNNVLVGECTANAGGAVYVKAGTFSISGDTRITPSGGADEQTAGKNDVYLKSGKVITVNSALTGTDPIARITPENYPAGSATVKVLDGAAVTTEYKKFKVTDQAGTPSKKWTLNASGELKAVGGQSPAVPVSNWEDLRTQVQSVSDGTVIEVTQDITYKGGSSESTITVNKNITIKSKDSNTYTLNADCTGTFPTYASKVKSIFKVTSGKSLILENVTLSNAKQYAVSVAENGSLMMTKVTIKDCETQDQAAGIYFNKGKDLTLLEKCIIENCKGKGNGSSGGMYIQEPKGTVSIKNTEIKNCEAQHDGGGIRLSQANCTLENVNIQECSAANGGGIYNRGSTGSTLTITGGSFIKNKVLGSGPNRQGGAIYSEGGSLTLDGFTIGGDNQEDGNTAKKGGGIYLKNVVVTMQSVKVKNNKALTQGGGIYLADGNLEIPAGNTIADNSATNNTASNHNSEAGGGIYVEKGTLTLNGGIISGNSANANKGGGVYLKAGTFTMNSGEIKNCSAKTGGGVSLAGTSTFTMTGGTITGCKAAAEGGVGGGVYTEQNTQLILEGTSSNPVVISQCMAEKAGGGMLIYTNKPATVKNAHIEENSAKTGGGVYLEQGRFTIVGSTRITPSTEATAGKNDVFLKEGKFITIEGTLTAESPIARITPENYTAGVKVLEVSSNDYTKFTVTPNSEGSWQVESNGTLKKP